MEKFGIFELLDTLSALTEPQKNTGNEIFPSPVPENPPAPRDAAPPPADAPAAKETNQRALQSLLDRHDGISKRIDGKK